VIWRSISNKLVEATENEFISNTLIHLSPLASFDRDSMHPETEYLLLNITGPIVEELLHNTTFAIFTYSKSRIDTKVSIIRYENCYILDAPYNLLAYLIVLLVSLVFIIAGLLALWTNGVAADGSFLQVLCTTTSSDALINTLAEPSCLGGSTNVSDDLKLLNVRFGEIKRKIASASTREDVADVHRIAGFGTVEETTPLVPGAKYG